MPTVSVIVTTYNREKLLVETIQGVLNQTYTDFELIVVDNCSNYDFIELMNSLQDPRIRAYQNQNDGIIAKNRNVGINHSRGKFLAFCDDDDVWLPEKLETQMRFLENGDYDLVYSNTNLMYENGTFNTTSYERTNTLKRLLKNNQITLSSVVVRNSEEVKFNESKLLVAVEDYDLWINLKINKFNFKFVETPLLNYRIIKSSASNRSKTRNEKVNLNYRISLLKNNKIPFLLKIFVMTRIIRRGIRYLIFSLLKL